MLPKASENPALTMDRFVSKSIITIDEPVELAELQESNTHDEDQFARESDDEV